MIIREKHAADHECPLFAIANASPSIVEHPCKGPHCMMWVRVDSPDSHAKGDANGTCGLIHQQKQNM